MPRSPNQTSAVPTKKRRSGHTAQWAAQFAVASELCKRGYEVAFTLGHNTPLADLMVVSPKNSRFLIDVKGLAEKNNWTVAKKEECKGLYYVLALVSLGQPNQFYILTQVQTNALIDRNRTRPSKRTQSVRDGFYFDWAQNHLNKWSALPD